jgi:Zn-dependent protease with chaperone function
MRPAKIARIALVRRAMPLACAVLLAGCTTSPTSGRAQFNVLPGALETSVPDLRFGVKTLLVAGGDYCREEENPCPAREAAEKLAQRIAPIAERLGARAAELSPEMTSRVPQVEVFVVPGDSPSVTSSAGGKIAVGAGLARLELSDTDLALALAREFGRLAAAHHRESTSAGLAVSLIAGSPLTSAYLATSILADIIFPMGALAKVGLSLLASMGTEQLVEASQQDEADEFAAKLMLAAGYDPVALAEPRPDAPQGTVRFGWLSSYFTSRAKIAAMAQPDPWPDEAPAPLALAAAAEPWPDEALPLLAAANEPWPDEAQDIPGSPAEPLKAETPKPDKEILARMAEAGPAAKGLRQAQVAPPKGRNAKAPASKKPVIKKTRGNARANKKITRPVRKTSGAALTVSQRLTSSGGSFSAPPFSIPSS